MLPDEVREAMKELDAAHDDRYAPWRDQWQTIRAHLLAREAEVEMLRAPFSDEDATAGSHWFGEWVTWKRRCERAEALLRECLSRLGPEWTRGNIPINPDASLHNRITATLLEKDNGPLRK